MTEAPPLDHERWMALALELAERGARLGEVPVGAVIVREGQLIGSGFNRPISACDPSAHAEILALREAATRAGNYRLPGATLYTTIEPCSMCAGALVHARISHLIFGAREPKAGAVISQSRMLDAPYLNWRIDWREGVLADGCASLVSGFFTERRRVKRVHRK